jgi:hypothetical protein
VLVAIAGGVIVLSGTLAVAPWAVAGLERLASRISPSTRLAGRSLARARVRSSAVVGAICSLLAVLVAGSTLYASDSPGTRVDDLPYYSDHHVVVQAYRTSGDETVRQVVDAVDGTAVPLDRVVVARNNRNLDVYALVLRDGDGTVGSDLYSETRDVLDVGIGSPGLLDALEVPDGLRTELDRGAAIATVPFPEGAEDVHFLAGGARADAPLGGSFASPVAGGGLPNVLISEELAEQLGFDVRRSGQTLVDAGHALTDDERHRLDLINDDINFALLDDPDRLGDIYVEAGEKELPVTRTEVRLAVYGLVMLAVGLVVAVGLGLAAKDAQDENQVLGAVGAPPRTLRRVGALRGALLVATATVIAVPTGVFSAWAVLAALRSDQYLYEEPIPFRVDLATLGFLAAVPVVVALVALTWGGVRDRVRPARPDTFVFAD